MKKLTKGLAAAVVILGAAGTAPQAGAFSCDDANIGYTGPRSVNEIRCENDTRIRVVCENNIYVAVNNEQDAESGDAEVEGNTSGGNATSGSAINENGTAVRIGAACGEAAEVPGGGVPVQPGGNGGAGGGAVTPSSAQPVPAPAPAAPLGMGAAGGAGAVAIEVLPETSADPTLGISVLTAMMMTGFVGLSKLTSSTYGRQSWQAFYMRYDKARDWFRSLIAR